MHRSSFLFILVITVLCAEGHNGSSVLENSGISGAHLQRRKKRETCVPGEFYVQRKGFCCQKCASGYKVKKDCECHDCRTGCEPCSPGTYLELQNYRDKCFTCKKCDTDLGQITKSECTTTKNTVCGCPDEYYKIRLGEDKFKCESCTKCNNVQKTCHEFNDTVCKCDDGFYFNHEKKSCLSCGSCTNPESDLCNIWCLQHAVVATKPPEKYNAAIVPAIVFAVACVIITVLFVVYFIKNHHREIRSIYSQVSETVSPESSAELVIGIDNKAPGFQSVVTVCPVTAITELPDCVKNARNINLPGDSETLYKVVDAVPATRWKEFVRRLGLPDSCIDRLDYENRYFFREAQYEMMKCWCLKKGSSGATIEAIYKVLTEMDLSGCAEMIQESLHTT